MHSKPQKRTAARLTCRESWKSCLPAKTKARARMPPPFLQLSCALRSRFEAVLNGSEKVKLYAWNQRQGRRHHWREQRNRRGIQMRIVELGIQNPVARASKCGVRSSEFGMR